MTNDIAPHVPSPSETLTSEHTGNLAALLEQLGISLLITTYQAGKLVIVRSEGADLNAHFRSFNKPMGLAADGVRLIVGTAQEIIEYHNIPAVCDKLSPKGQHDACYVPRSGWVTGDIDIHEMAFDAKGVLWFINTRFSCLCTLDGSNSFVPRWRPEFVKGLGPEDRCHLNGLGMRKGVPRYATALGESDERQGWRARKADGGVLIDIETNLILCRNLSMPHSPRWYADQLWVLESGRGSLEAVNDRTGKHETVVELPGFTRGMDFFGSLAFIGLSQVRETTTFSGIPIMAQTKERNCGVWVINLQTQQVLGALRFKSGVHEIFAVQILKNQRFPELLASSDSLVGSSYVLSDQALNDVHPPSEAVETVGR